MSDAFRELPIGASRFQGYTSDPNNADPSYLAPPSVNCLITDDGKAESRMGYQEEFAIGSSGNAATCYYMKTYDVAFFALGTQLFYRDFAAGQTFDTGLSLTAGTTTRFAEFFGDLYLTNTTDGVVRVVVTRLNGAVAAGAQTVTLDQDGAARLAVFGDYTGNLRIRGTNEGFANPVVPFGSVSTAANNGSGLIRITSAANHNLTTGEQVTISGVTGTTEANGTWTVTRVSATTFDLQGSTFTNAYVSGGTFAHSISGVVRLSGAASQAYTDNTLVLFVDNSYSSLEKFSKIEFWKSRLHGMGFPNATNADQPNNTVLTGKFVIGQTGASGIEDIVSMPLNAGGSTKIVIGGGGKLTNILGVDDTFYFFTEDKVHDVASSSIPTSGDSIGLTVPDEQDKNHGCLNEDCAISMGNGEVAYPTNDRRIMRQRIATDTGAAVTFSDESFDVDIRDHLKNMDRDQTGALAWHYKGQRKSIFQIKCGGQWYWFIWDHNITRTVGSTVINGAWQPPQQIAPVRGFFERNGVLYGTDASTDKVYSYFTTFTDNLSPIQVTIATGEFNVGDAMMGKAHLEGEVNQPSQINICCYVWNNSAGKRSGSPKVINGNVYSYSDDQTVGAVPVGGAMTGASTQVAKWKKQFGIFPSQAIRAQLVLENFQDGGYCSLTAYSLSGKQYPNSFSKSL